MSTGIVVMADPPRIVIRNAMTTKVYGRRSASLTIHICPVRPRAERRCGPCVERGVRSGANLSRVTIRLRQHLTPPSTYARANWLFLRALGLVYLTAFWSLGVQVRGLAGHEGILPADSYLATARGVLGIERFWLLPTVAWFDASGPALLTLCVA